MQEPCSSEQSSSCKDRRNFLSNNVTLLNYRKELTACKGKQKLKKKRKKSESAKKKRALKNASKRNQQGKEVKHKHGKDDLQLCKIHKSKKCLKNDGKCRLHNYNTIKKHPDLCRRYSNGCCPNGQDCTYMHEEFPCKFYHLGAQCYAGDKCLFSHAPLNKKSREILFNYLAKMEKNKDLDNNREQASQKVQTAKSLPFKNAAINDPHIDQKSTLEPSAADPTPQDLGKQKLNFYVDTLQESSVASKPNDGPGVDLDELFIQSNTESESSCPLEISLSDIGLNGRLSPPSPVFVKHGKILDPIKESQRLLKLQLKDARSDTNSDMFRNAKQANGALHSQIIQLLHINISNQDPDEEHYKNYLLKRFDVVGMFQSLIEEAQKKMLFKDCLPALKEYWKDDT